jgi:tRNA-dihydrouridine synthase B
LGLSWPARLPLPAATTSAAMVGIGRLPAFVRGHCPVAERRVKRIADADNLCKNIFCLVFERKMRDHFPMLHIGPYALRNNVLLAPMAGVTDAPFRAAAARLGAGLTIAEMAAGKELLAGRQRERLAGENIGAGPFAVQLAGHDPALMARATAVALAHGADIIDINMGCPAKMVTGKLSGAALMREPDLARAIVEAVVAAANGAPVTLKMRLGWDDARRNAADIALMAADAGVAMITVHGRTRRQFYAGNADWRAVGRVVRALRAAGHAAPVIVNGDIVDAETARVALARSGADGVMIGRAATGRPWLPGEIAEALAPGAGIAPLPFARQAAELARLHADMVAFHGERVGVRRARKHLKAALAHWRAEGAVSAAEAGRLREVFLRSESAVAVQDALAALAGGRVAA